MHRLFTINHLLHEICSYMSDSLHHLSVLARVSSIWFECAIPLLYKRVSVRDALAPLGKMQYVEGSGGWTFVTPRGKAFKRLSKYAPYVQHLIVDSSVPLLVEAARLGVSKDVTCLFPNTRSIELSQLCCGGFLDLSLSEYEEILGCFLSPKIDSLTLSTDNSHIFRCVCQLVKTRLSALRYLDIQGYRCLDTAAGRIAQSISSPLVESLLTCFAHTSTSVYIPLWLNTAPIIKCLSKMPNLYNLSIGHNQPRELKKRQRGEDRGGFTSLLSFSFEGSSESLFNMFLTPYNLSHLNMLSWNIDFTSADVGVVISTLVVTFPSLKTLAFGPLPIPLDSEEPWSVVPLPWSSIQPVSQCKQLTSLSFNRIYISVSLEELTEFLRSRTTWTHLDVFTFDPLRLRDILLYAEHCPQLEHLGIFLDDRLESFVELPHRFPSFPALAEIDLARSHITKRSTDSVVELLHRVCKNPPHIIHSDYLTNHDILKRLAFL